MRTKLHLVLSFTIIIACFSGSAQDGYWRQTAPLNDKMPDHLQKLDSKKVQFYSLDKAGLKAQLSALNDRKNRNATVYFPDTKGKMIAFRIEEAPVMSRELTDKYPDIRSYKGYSLANEEDRIRISISPKGVKTMIVHAGRGLNTYMDRSSDDNAYVVYQKSADLANKADFVCYTKAILDQKGASSEKSGTSTARLVDDQTLRTYRLAVSATGEYTQYHGGTEGDALAAINETLTRVNEVFETDLGIHLELVANNDLVIFTDPDTDPYGGNLNTEAQNTLDTTLGALNYDVGHVFNRGDDSGNAGFIGSVCQDGRKGSAFSQALVPEGDIFDLDFVSHELGHQFGANHTWSFQSEGTLVQAEPGSGTTIMGYAGIVPGNNVEPNGDEYFHYYSILQISEYVATQSCAQEVPLANNPPVITPGADYIIPVSTAFVLEGTATDPDVGDVLTYTWEQIDVGVVTSASFGPDNPSGANFRSLRPNTSPRRYFPRLSEVAQGNLTEVFPTQGSAWETVSDIERELNFALTVRDNGVGGGQVASDLVQVNVIENAGPFTVTSQASQETVTAGDKLLVTWDVANTHQTPIGAQLVDIFLSTDGGLSFPDTLALGTPNDGSAEVLIPGVSSTEARLMVKASNNIFFAVNAADFIIEESEIVLQFDALDYEVCQPDLLLVPFTYQTFSGFNEVANFEASGLPPGLDFGFTPSTATDDGTIVDIGFTGSGSTAPGTYPITIRAVTASITKEVVINVTIYDATFSDVVLISPSDGGTELSPNAMLMWEEEASATSYDLEIATDVAFTNIVESATLLFNSYLPELIQENTTYFWRVKPKNSCGEGSFGTPFSYTTIDINCGTFDASGLPLTISSSGTPTITSSIIILDDRPISDVNVTLDIDHTFVSDLVVTLQSPSGTSVTLLANACGSQMDIDAVFDNEAPSFVCGDNPAIGGTVKPLGSLASFNGETAAGEWILTIDDIANADGGALNVFSLEICIEGEFQEDTDGDGVFDDDDLCPGTPMGAEVDTDGCEVFRFAPNNFTISVESESCIGSNDGVIVITAQSTMDYTVDIDGPGVSASGSFTNTFTQNNIPGGTYTVCINGTEGVNVFEEICFDVTIDEPEPLSVSSQLSANGSQVILNLSGSVLYNIELNGDLIQTNESEIAIDLKPGANSLKVSSLQTCQGNFEQELFYSTEPFVYPNPFIEVAFVNLISKQNKAVISVHSTDGRLLMKKTQSVGEIETALDFSNLPSGLYFVRVESGQETKSFKVIKR